jgi:hypothetical protein
MLILPALATPSRAQVAERVSVAVGGAQGNQAATGGSVEHPASADGRFIVFGSQASNLVANDNNGLPDVFIRDRLTGLTELISVSSIGSQGNGFSGSGAVSVSADGAIVAFDSTSTNLVPGDTNGWLDIFVRDRSNGVTERVSVSTLGLEADAPSIAASLSADARYVAFESPATNLVGGDLNQCRDCFVRDRLAGTTERISVSSAGAEGNDSSIYPTISGDGRFVEFVSLASNLVPGDNRFVGIGSCFKQCPHCVNSAFSCSEKQRRESGLQPRPEIGA